MKIQPTSAFLAELNRLHYNGACSVGVYNSRLPRLHLSLQARA